jgi:Flp pilus assembly protein TadD
MRDAVLKDFEASLNRMTQIGERVEAEMVFVTPASNIGDFSPFKSEPSGHLSPLEIDRVDSLKRMVIKAIYEGNYIEAEVLVIEALKIDARDPDLLYQHGQALRHLGRIDQAHHAFVKSKDEDICPLRALTPVRAIVTDVAVANKTGFVDFVNVVNEQSPDGIAGSELFLDHVHPTIEGNRLLALAIMEAMSKDGIIYPPSAWDEDAIAEISEAHMNSLDEQTHAIALRNLSKVLGWAGKDEEAARLANMALTMIPEDSEAQTQEGLLLWRAGNREEALVHLQEASSLDPYNAGLHRSLGILLSEMGRMSEAQLELEEAIRLDPDLVDVYYDIGVVLQSMGKMGQAETAFRTALQRDPNNADACNNLGIILAQRGDFEAAYEQFARALELEPDHENAAVNMANARRAMGEMSN